MDGVNLSELARVHFRYGFAIAGVVDLDFTARTGDGGGRGFSTRAIMIGEGAASFINRPVRK